MSKEDKLIDERALYRIKRQEREKEKQLKKYREKIESTDWLKIVSSNQGGIHGRGSKTR